MARIALLALPFLLACTGKDGTTDSTPVATGTDADGDGYFAEEDDCDDADEYIHPDANEACDEVDNDCDGEADEGVATTYYADVDGDGFGDLNAPIEACSRPDGATTLSTDCDDADASVYPVAPEVCDGADNNCDGLVDDEDPNVDLSTAGTYYADSDGDLYGDPNNPIVACTLYAGIVADDSDCDDTDLDVRPGATEVCNGYDDDCDLAIDDVDRGLDATTGTIYYADADGDGEGDATSTVQTCDPPEGYVAGSTDCDDANAAIYSGASEVCNGYDDDCDGLTDINDPGVTDSFVSYADSDADGYGAGSASAKVCTLASGYALVDTDCDDKDSAISPGARDTCGDGIDNDCDSEIDETCSGGSGDCADLQIVSYYDSFSSGSSPIEVAGGLFGLSVKATSDSTSFASAYDAGGWDVVVIDIPGSSIPDAVTTRVKSAISDGTVVLFSYWYLGYDASLPSILGVTVSSSYTTPKALYPSSTSKLWEYSESMPNPIKGYSDDAGTNGQILSASDTSTSETLGIYDGDEKSPAIIATYSGQVLVNGFLPWDFQDTDDDSDGVGDMEEMYINELAWAFDCSF